MGLYILIFEIFIIVFYGIFVRTGYSMASISDLEAPLYFTLGTYRMTKPIRCSAYVAACTTGPY